MKKIIKRVAVLQPLAKIPIMYRKCNSSILKEKENIATWVGKEWYKMMDYCVKNGS